jgi:uncharacterized protein (TIGR02145 family)
MDKAKYIMAGGLVLTTIISSLMLSSSTSADTTTVEASVSVPESCSLSGTGTNSHNADIANGTYQSGIGTTTLKAMCNDSGGFAIYAIGFTNEEYTGTDHTKLIGVSNGQKITTGTSTSGATSNWAMKLETSSGAAYPITLDNGYGSYTAVPDTYTKVAHRATGTDVGSSATGSVLTTTYAAYISSDQIADTYSGKVKYTLVHPSTETPTTPQATQSGKICYYPNGGNVEGTMGCQAITSSDTSVTLLASNFSRTGYGFAGWSTTYDYSTTGDDVYFYGPQEDITFTAGQYTGNNPGLSLYAIWVKSKGNFQDSAKTTSVCNSLTAASTSGTRTLASISALTDARDNQTYAIAKLADSKCWMIENLRLDNTAELTLANTNNPLNDGTNVTLKHNYTDTDTYNTLSATSSVAYDADTAPDGWCTSISAACYDQSRLRTDNTANRATYTSGQTVSSQDANLYSYGNYYNWYSATAGNGTYSKSSGEVAGDLCPTGWKLPYGKSSGNGNTPGGFYYLNYKINNDSDVTNADASKKLRAYPNNFIYSGNVYGGSVNYRGSVGYYWPSTAYSSANAYSLLFNSSGVIPGINSGLKYYGWPVRCAVSSA